MVAAPSCRGFCKTLPAHALAFYSGVEKGGGPPSSQSPAVDKMAAACGWRGCLGLLVLACALAAVLGAEGPEGGPPKQARKKKDIRDYNDADMARLLEQWEVCWGGGRRPFPPLSSTPLCLVSPSPLSPSCFLKRRGVGRTARDPVVKLCL